MQADETQTIVKAEANAETDLNEDIDEILASAEKKSAVEKHVKSEPNADDAEISPDFFDEILLRAEEESRQQFAAIALNTEAVKAEHNEAEEGEIVEEEDNGSNADKNKSSKNKIKSSKITDKNNRPLIQIRADLCAPSSSSQNLESQVSQATKVVTSAGNSVNTEENTSEQVIKILTPEEKLCKALENIIYARKAFERANQQKELKFYPNNTVFMYTPTIRKLPHNSSHFTQQLYDNRSPLHTVKNVSFQFNSISTRLDLKEWGLEALTPTARRVARTLGYDADTLYAKLQIAKIPDKIKKSTGIDPIKGEETCELTNSTLFMNAMVQTDEVRILPKRRSEFYRDVGTQSSQGNAIGTQNNRNHTGRKFEDLPLFQMIQDLNENQLQALDEFVRLIREPIEETDRLGLYQQNTRLSDIYRIARRPSEHSNPLKRTAATADLLTEMPTPPPPPNLRHFEYETHMQQPFMPITPMQPHFRSGPFNPVPRRQEANIRPQNSQQKFYGRGRSRK